ncbi:MAG: ABC transporter permease [Acidimicrobiales bacterium]
MVVLALRSLWTHKRRVVGTSVSIVLGVSFLTASLVLGDTMRAGFSDLFGQANDGTAVVVRRAGGLTPTDGVSGRGTVPVDVAATVGALPGVDTVALQIDGTAQIIGSDGGALGGDGPPTLAGNWIDDPRLSPWVLADGVAPVGAGQVVIDRNSAQRGDLAVGDTTTVRTPAPVEVTVVGIATFGELDSAGPTTQVLFDTPVAQALFLGDADAASSIRIAAVDGVDQDQLATAVADVVPTGIEAITGTELAEEQLAELDADFISFFEAMLLVFAGVGLLVATFSIHNTLSILVAQQARTSALLRAIGASRGQVVGSTLTESVLIGLGASIVGFVAGLGLAVGGLAVMAAVGAEVPGGLRWSAATASVAIGVGVVITLVASVVPIITTSRIAPLAAVRSLAVEQVDVSGRRTLAGLVVGAAAVAVLVAGPTTAAALGVATVALLVAAVLVGPRLSRPIALVVGRPIERLRGRAGVLAVRNAVRNPRRTATTASALMVGVAVVTGFTVLASSASASIDQMVSRSFTGDLTVYDQAFSGPGLPPTLASEVAQLPEVATAVGLGVAVVDVDGSTANPTVTDPALLSSVFDPGVVAGDLAAVQGDTMAVSQRHAEAQGWDLGDEVTLGFPSGTTTEVEIVALFRETDPLGDLVLPRQVWESAGGRSGDILVLIDLEDGVGTDAGREAVTVVTERVGAPAPLDQSELVDTVSAEIDQALTIVYVLLAIAIVIAVLGIGNTISLAIHERTRELGVLRAVGLTRPQLRSMVRWESAIIAVFGTILGLGLGVLTSWAAVRTISADGAVVMPMTASPTSLATIALLGALAGVMAGWRPARRAARADVLGALSAG